jgi:hypothetical protein
MTPYELTLYNEAYVETKESELKDRLTLVWLGEYYHRTKKLPRLKDELRKISSEKQQRVMTNDEMLETVKRLNRQFGGTVKNGGE